MIIHPELPQTLLQLTQNKDIEISETTKYDLGTYIDRDSLR